MNFGLMLGRLCFGEWGDYFNVRSELCLEARLLLSLKIELMGLYQCQ